MNASLSCSDLVGFYEFLVRKQETFIEKALQSFSFAFGFLNFQGKGIFLKYMAYFRKSRILKTFKCFFIVSESFCFCLSAIPFD